MNLQKIGQVVDMFESKFEDLDVVSQVIEDSMAKTTADLAKVDDVDELICQVADEYNLELKELLPELAEVAEQQKLKQQPIKQQPLKQGVLE